MKGDEEDLEKKYYLALAAAFVRGAMPEVTALSDRELVRIGLAAGLRLHKFKRTAGLPRVRRALGMLRGLGPAELLDLGSGRGVFLWPLLDAFPEVSVTALDRDAHRAADMGAVARGGIDRLHAVCADAARLPLPDRAVDGVTVLEVLEHQEDPAPLAREAVRVARSFVIASVPSRPDDNPEHLHLFGRDELERLLRDAGARRVRTEAVLNHFLALATV